ncbi:Expansin B [Meloidogyne graminicola]|uniref:Expansin B n=1 Tax=Meloidogyne graminicola TaxID=189291 RepID=A0A8S9ZGA4_9BILA|nr:Expansin B [Meloidogyne graminicola]
MFTLLCSKNIVLSWVLNQPSPCDFTYYIDAGYGACGTLIDANNQDLAAISYTQWVGGNPNNDPICKNICVKIDYNGKSIKVPVKDKCPSCTESHVDLSRTAFMKLANLNIGHVYGATKTFAIC